MARLLDETIRAYPADEQPPGSWWLPASYGGSAPTLEEAAALDAEEKRERARARAAKRKASAEVAAARSARAGAGSRRGGTVQVARGGRHHSEGLGQHRARDGGTVGRVGGRRRGVPRRARSDVAR